MNIHKNARLTPYRRGALVTRAARGEPVAGLARQFGVSLRTARKWRARYRARRGPRLAGPLQPAAREPAGHGPGHPARD